MELTCDDLGFAAGSSFTVRDLWAHEDAGTAEGSYSAPVAPHGVVMVRVQLVD